MTLVGYGCDQLDEGISSSLLVGSVFGTRSADLIGILEHESGLDSHESTDEGIADARFEPSGEGPHAIRLLLEVELKERLGDQAERFALDQVRGCR